MTSHVQKITGNLLYGSVIEKVQHSTTIPLLVVQRRPLLAAALRSAFGKTKFPCPTRIAVTQGDVLRSAGLMNFLARNPASKALH